MNVDEAAELGIFIVRRCIENVDGCDGPISVLTWKIGQTGWAPCHPDEVNKIEERFEKQKLRDNLLDFWIAQTPHLVRHNPLYRKLSQGGFVNFCRAVGLRGTPDNPSQLVSKTTKNNKKK
jgi:hypothetical protein